MQKNEWYTLEYKPVDPLDVAFINSMVATSPYDSKYYADGVVVADDTKPFVGGYITCPVAGMTFDWEAWAVVEYAGPNVPGKTINPPDPQGFACVLAAFAEVDTFDANALTASHNDFRLTAGELGGGYVGGHPATSRASANPANHWDTAWNWSSTAGQVGEVVIDYASRLLRASAPAFVAAAGTYVNRRLQQPRVELIE